MCITARMKKDREVSPGGQAGGGLRESRVRRPDCRASRATQEQGKLACQALDTFECNFTKKKRDTQKERGPGSNQINEIATKGRSDVCILCTCAA